MRTEQTKNAQVAFGHDDQTLYDQSDLLQTAYPVLRKHYQALREHYQALLEHYPTMRANYPDVATFCPQLQDYCQSQQELRRLIQHFRKTLHAHRVNDRSYRRMQNGGSKSVRPLIRTTILLGVSHEQDAAFLKEGVQQAGNHRVFVATDKSEVLCMMQNVQIDLLVLDDELTARAGIDLYKQVLCMKGLKVLPTIIMGDCFSPSYQEVQAHTPLIRLERPIKVDALVKAINQLLV